MRNVAAAGSGPQAGLPVAAPGRPAAGAAFEGLLRPGPERHGPLPSTTGMPALQASLLLTIQNAIPGERRRRNLARAETLLAGLEGLHQAIAAGEVDEGGLRTLGAALAQAGGDAPDPELADMLAAIELRVAVELAKLAS